MKETTSQIYYIFLLGERENILLTNIPPSEVVHPMMSFIGRLPQHMEHFIYGYDYYFFCLKSGFPCGGYRTIFVHPDTVESLKDVFFDSNGVYIFLMCSDNESVRRTYASHLQNIVTNDTIFVVSKGTANIGNLPGKVIDEPDDLWEWFYQYSVENYNIDDSRLPFSVLYFSNKGFYEVDNPFRPAKVNTQILNGILGNWGYGEKLTEEESYKRCISATAEAIRNKDSFARQNGMVKQIAKIHSLELEQARAFEKIRDLEDQFIPPLIIIAPYNSVEMRKPFDLSEIPDDEKEIAKNLNAVMNVHYTKNYTINVNAKAISINPVLYDSLQQDILKPRMEFLDNVGLLHASIRFSPYIKLPLMGKNINSELSFVGFKEVRKLVQSKNANKNIRKVMEAVGRKIAKESMSPECMRMLNGRASQIVAMTDLPFEWVMNDGIPLAFTHDICRLPETPTTSLLSLYEQTIFTQYVVPKDILSKTLVVFGNDDDSFVKCQKGVIALSKKFGFKTKRCLKVSELTKAISEYKPELLIIDAHGEVDKDTKQSFLWIGEEKLTGDMVISNGINARIVFLSACNTFTTCNTVSTIANAFFEAGASSVTTSYMPVQIEQATFLYTRLLRLLNEAAQKPIHKNWLAFISHLQRTSYIQALKTEADNAHKTKLTIEDLSELTLLTTKSMFFRERREIYKSLQSLPLAKKMGLDYSNIIPHYLMYSTLGRADLILFESWIENKMNAETSKKT